MYLFVFIITFIIVIIIIIWLCFIDLAIFNYQLKWQ